MYIWLFVDFVQYLVDNWKHFLVLVGKVYP